MRDSHEIDYEIVGEGIQAVEVELDPGEVVIAEAGAMNWFEEGIEFEAKTGDGSKKSSGFWGAALDMGKRVITGESLFITHFENHGRGKKKISFAAPFPGKIVPIDLAEMPYNQIICQKDSFLCAAKGTSVDIEFTRRLGAGFFGGEGFILQKLSGNGMAFLNAGGSVIVKEIHDETLFLDTGCLVGFAGDIDFDIQKAGNLKSMLFGGEGLFLTKISGTGLVFIQTMPFSRLANTIIAHAPSMGGSRQGEGSILGTVGDIIDGD